MRRPNKVAFFCLSSGSNSNCFYLGYEDYGILIDAGLGIRKTLQRLQEHNIEIESITAILITHDHIDHIRAVAALGERREIPVYATPKTIEGINSSGTEVISVDINSGMNGDTGEAEIAVRSDLTVTIGYVKNGLVTENAGRYMKRLRCTDIGIELAYEENKIQAPGEAGEGMVCPAWLDMNIIRIEEAVL